MLLWSGCGCDSGSLPCVRDTLSAELVGICNWRSWEKQSQKPDFNLRMKWNLVCSNEDPKIKDQRPHTHLLSGPGKKCDVQRLAEAVLEAFHRGKKPVLRYGVCYCRPQWGFCCHCTAELQFWPLRAQHSTHGQELAWRGMPTRGKFAGFFFSCWLFKYT